MKIIEDKEADGYYGRGFLKSDDIREAVKGKYGDEILISKLSRAEYMSMLLNGLKGKRILDLGCGSRLTRKCISSLYELSDDDRRWEPWLSRILHESGARIVGIDLLSQENEEFEWYRKDLSLPNSLEQFNSEEFDLACSFDLFSDSLLYSLRGDSGGERTLNNLMPQLERIVKKQGFFIVDFVGSGFNTEMCRSEK